MRDIQKSAAFKRLYNVQNNLYNYLRKVGKNGDLSSLLDIEHHIIEDDLLRYANSPEMTSSLKTALTEIDVIKEHTKIVADPVQYQSINKDHSLPKKP
ncbi:hypothetical protein [Bartonella sp. CB169]|uniref:hypothetical protein n=1 Tax=Bartonella sp. CB169 TaxID=3112257 RepID=UPI00300E180C